MILKRNIKVMNDADPQVVELLNNIDLELQKAERCITPPSSMCRVALDKIIKARELITKYEKG